MPRRSKGSYMFEKRIFDELEPRLEAYFRRFPSAERVGIIIRTHQADYLVAEIIDYDDRFITFAHWPLENADIPRTWGDVRDSLVAVTIPYHEITAIEFDPKVVRGREIGFT